MAQRLARRRMVGGLRWMSSPVSCLMGRAGCAADACAVAALWRTRIGFWAGSRGVGSGRDKPGGGPMAGSSGPDRPNGASLASRRDAGAGRAAFAACSCACAVAALRRTRSGFWAANGGACGFSTGSGGVSGRRDRPGGGPMAGSSGPEVAPSEAWCSSASGSEENSVGSRAEAGAEGRGGDDVESVRVAEVMEEEGAWAYHWSQLR